MSFDEYDASEPELPDVSALGGGTLLAGHSWPDARIGDVVELLGRIVSSALDEFTAPADLSAWVDDLVRVRDIVDMWVGELRQVFLRAGGMPEDLGRELAGRRAEREARRE